MDYGSESSLLEAIVCKIATINTNVEGLVLDEASGGGQKILALCNRIEVVDDGEGAKQIVKKTVQSFLPRIWSATLVDDLIHLKHWKVIRTSKTSRFRHVSGMIGILVSMLKEKNP